MRTKGLKEHGIKWLLFASALSAVLIIFAILYFLISNGAPIFTTTGPSFFTNTLWNPTGTPPSYGILALIVGTLLVTGLAMLIAIPLSLASAIYIAELATPRQKAILKPTIELLAGIPSVVIGFFGLIILTTWLRVNLNLPTGETWLAGSILLGIMAIPTITSVAEDAITAVPKEYKEGSLALGATRWQTIHSVLVPTALSGITAAIILGIGRAIGETIVVMMVCGNPTYGLIPTPIYNIFAPIKTLTATLGIETGEVATGSTHYAALFGIAITLLLITLLINLLATTSLQQLNKKRATKTTHHHQHHLHLPISRHTLTQTLTFTLALLSILLIYAATGLLTTSILILTLTGLYLLHHYLTAHQRQLLAFTLLTAALLTIITILAIILGYIIINGIPALNWTFLTTSPTNLGRSGGILPAIIGTLYLVTGAILIALPLGVATAIYLTEYTRETILTRIIRAATDLLNGTPSIVFGLFGFAFLVLYLRLGFSLIAGQITLAFMILPTIIRTTEESLRSVPQGLREGSLALGATRWQTIRRVVLAPATPGVLTGAILGIGRAAGETAPILFTAAAFTAIIPTSVTQPVNALPYHLFTLTTSIPGSTTNQAGTALVLLLVVFAFYLLAILIRNHYNKTTLR